MAEVKRAFLILFLVFIGYGNSAFAAPVRTGCNFTEWLREIGSRMPLQPGHRAGNRAIRSCSDAMLGRTHDRA